MKITGVYWDTGTPWHGDELGCRGLFLSQSVVTTNFTPVDVTGAPCSADVHTDSL